MKITLPLPTEVTTGYNYGIVETYDADHRFLGQVEIDQRLTETRLTPTVVFDYDFKAARRARAAGHLLHTVAHLAVVFPLAVVFVAGREIGKGIEFVADKLDDLMIAHGVQIGWGVRDTLANQVREIVVPA